MEVIDDLRSQNIEYKDFLKHLLPEKSYDRLRAIIFHNYYTSIENASDEIFRLYFDIQEHLAIMPTVNLERLKYISRFPDPDRSSFLDPQFEPLLEKLTYIQFLNFFQDAKQNSLSLNRHSFFKKRAKNFNDSLFRIFIYSYKNFEIPCQKIPNYYEKISRIAHSLEDLDFNLLSGLNFHECSYHSFQKYLSPPHKSIEIPLAILIGKIENYAWISSGLFYKKMFSGHMVLFRIQSELKYLAWKN